MKNVVLSAIAATALVAFAVSPLSAGIIFEDDFDIFDTSEWTKAPTGSSMGATFESAPASYASGDAVASNGELVVTGARHVPYTSWFGYTAVSTDSYGLPEEGYWYHLSVSCGDVSVVNSDGMVGVALVDSSIVGELWVSTNGNETIDITWDSNGDGAYSIDGVAAGIFSLDSGASVHLGLYAVSLSGAEGHFDSCTLELNAVPEPSTLALLACGLFALLCYAWRRRR